jgi:hypothetical protein
MQIPMVIIPNYVPRYQFKLGPSLVEMSYGN